MSAEPRLARIAAAIADPTRARVLARLLDGRLHTAGELATHAGVGAATMSAHLKLLVDEGLARVRPQGRHRYFGLADGDVAHALEALLRVADGRDAGAAADLKRWQKPEMRGLRHARSCYGHLAGELGVQWREALLAKGWVRASSDGRYELSDAGREALRDLMPEGFAATGRVLYDCVDWSERRDHFAGPLAVAWLEAMVAKGWLQRMAESRELRLTPPGRLALESSLT
ncbi:DNA-binding transcriptional ArsR family regulator [Pelomonas saccharophila]|uniref:DNA-binding transcriptional ArsR family regulator n=1 Tax=Roseateles saccharophilus TaxID=304 RepID=A0ABU1YPQ8_ROSSA|nr:winged helix-turn-helix domain-containing protein [Roseateles saccharophilus]MDR7270848.1 DNA-binding transcriptional ArsR family regulator [Roseateles saccharophilus]